MVLLLKSQALRFFLPCLFTWIRSELVVRLVLSPQGHAWRAGPQPEVEPPPTPLWALSVEGIRQRSLSSQISHSYEEIETSSHTNKELNPRW